MAYGNPYAARYSDIIRDLEEERERYGITDEMMAEAGRDAPYGLSPAEQRARSADPDAGRGALKSQRAFANMLRGSKLPELKKVGPSGISVMNKWEGLETMFNRIAGGYLAGKADKKEAGLDAAVAEQRAIEQKVEDAKYTTARGDVALEQAMAQGKFELSEQAQLWDEGAPVRALKVANEVDRRKVLAATKAHERSGEKRKLIFFHHPDDPTNTLGLLDDGRGGFEDPDTKETYTASEVKLLTPYTPPRDTGSVGRQKTKATLEEEARQREDPAGNSLGLTQILRSPLLDSSVGYNLDALMGKVGWDTDDELGPARQDLQRKINTQTLEGFSDNLEQLKLTPVSDTEGLVLRSDVLKTSTQPFGVVGYAVDTIRPLLVTKFDEAIKLGHQTEEKKQEVLDELDSAAAYQAFQTTTDFPEQRLLDAGVSQEIIDTARAEVAAEQGGAEMQALTEKGNAIARKIKDLEEKRRRAAGG